MVYAVKKIIFTYRKDSDYNKVMREVKSFAGLSHMNVVGYNHAWVQTVEQHSEVLTESSSTSDSSSGESDPVEFFSTSTPLYRDSNRSCIFFCLKIFMTTISFLEEKHLFAMVVI
ncbi:UNVERIFIED_CONTAM: Eukaryotic translation initiation factor 2-alpha kinase 1 [Trichonephila clavipes]